MLRQNLTVFVLLAMVATAATATLFLPVETTEAGPINQYAGTEDYTCTRDHDGHVCIDKSRPLAETYEPFLHKVGHTSHPTNYVQRDITTSDRVSVCSGCCAPW